jgi:hypothetical protein
MRGHPAYERPALVKLNPFNVKDSEASCFNGGSDLFACGTGGGFVFNCYGGNLANGNCSFGGKAGLAMLERARS